MQKRFNRKCETGCKTSHRKCSTKIVPKNFALFKRKYLSWNLFLIKLQGWRPVTLLKRDYNSNVFIWILRNFQEHLFWRTSANGCFWGSLNPLHVTCLFLYPLKTSKNESLRYFQRVYKETNGAQWVHTPLQCLFAFLLIRV